MTKISKVKNQIKSYQYYLFWGACTFAVMAGQIYVGAGYKSMSQSVKDLTETITIKMEWDELNQRRGTGPYMPMVDPDDYIKNNGLENFELSEDDTPELFNSDANEELSTSPQEIISEEEEDLEIPAFLRRQKN